MVCRATLYDQETLRANLKLKGGQDRLQLIAEGLAVKDAGTWTSNSLAPIAANKGDVILPYLERMIEKASPENCWRLTMPLGSIDTPQATEMILRLYGQEKTARRGRLCPDQRQTTRSGQIGLLRPDRAVALPRPRVGGLCEVRMDRRRAVAARQL